VPSADICSEQSTAVQKTDDGRTYLWINSGWDRLVGRVLSVCVLVPRVFVLYHFGPPVRLKIAPLLLYGSISPSEYLLLVVLSGSSGKIRFRRFASIHILEVRS
jgi:hypothetical protein